MQVPRYLLLPRALQATFQHLYDVISDNSIPVNHVGKCEVDLAAFHCCSIII